MRTLKQLTAAGVLHGAVWMWPALAATPALEPEPIRYTVRFPDRTGQVAAVEARVPAEKAATELFIPVWSPGFYKVEDYAAQVLELSAKGEDGKEMVVDHPPGNRWTVHNDGATWIVLSYKLHCENPFVTTNWVGDEFAILNGPATFITLVEKEPRPHEVVIELPDGWNHTATGLQTTSANHFRAPSYELLVDCPIAAGNFDVREFEVAGSKHAVVSLGQLGMWDPSKPPSDLAQIVTENKRLWGELPYSNYVFLLNFRPGGGGLEHLNSTLITSGTSEMRTPARYTSWLSLVSHEYFHAFNVKRLRPIELGPFDYENPPHTPSLWISEGLTAYYGDVILCRTGLEKPDMFLQRLSSYVTQLQNSPGRLEQSLEQASMEVWTNSRSGVQTNEHTVSYYIKGPIVGLLLDAKIRAATDGKKSLDDAMRLAYKRYSGTRGFKPEEFVAAAEEVAGINLKEWFRLAVSSPGELEYGEALEYFGLALNKPDIEKGPWRLVARADATEAQKQRLNQWLAASDK